MSTYILHQALRMEFWSYTNQARRRSSYEDGLTEKPGFCNLLKAGASLCSCGFNRQVQDVSQGTSPWSP